MHSPNWFETLVNAVVGTDWKKMRRAPEDNAAYALRLFVQIVFSFVFISMIAYTAISIALPPTTLFRVLVNALAALCISTLVVAVDIHIIQSLWIEHGKKDLDRAAGIRRAALPFAPLFARIALAAVLSGSMGLYLDLKIFEPEIVQKLTQKFEAANATLAAEVAQDLQSRAAELKAEHEQLVTQRQSLATRIAAFEDHGDPDLARMADDIKDLDSDNRDIDKQIADLQKEKASIAQSEELEKGGVRVEGRTTGLTGCGPQCKLLQSEIGRIDREIAALAARKEENARRQTGIAADKARHAPVAAASVGDKLADMRKLRADRETRFEEVSRQLEQARADTKGLVLARMKDDPRFVPYEDGLAARFVALSEVVEEKPRILVPIILTSIVMIMLELNAVLTKIFMPPKSIYGVLAAQEYDIACELLAGRRFSLHPIARLADDPATLPDTTPAPSAPQGGGSDPTGSSDAGSPPPAPAVPANDDTPGAPGKAAQAPATSANATAAPPPPDQERPAIVRANMKEFGIDAHIDVIGGRPGSLPSLKDSVNRPTLYRMSTHWPGIKFFRDLDVDAPEFADVPGDASPAKRRIH